MNALKKSISAALAVIIALSCCTAAWAKTYDDGKLDIFVISDTHFESAELIDISTAEGLPGSELYYHANIQGQLSYESEAILRSSLDDFLSSEAKVLLISGDITNGELANHRAIAKIFKAVEAAGKKIFVINGNHDIEASDFDRYASMESFKEIYACFGYNEALSVDENSCSYTVDLDENYRLITIDSCIYGDDNGRITDSTLKWVGEQAIQAKKDGKYLIGMMHHSIIPHLRGESLIEGSQLISNYEEISSEFADWGIKYVFTGHTHANDISQAVSDNGSRIYDVMTGSLITSPNAYRKITFAPDKVSVNTFYVTDIDTDYLPEGFNQAQLDAMRTDFPAYSKGYFEAGITRWINSYLGTPRKLAKIFNLEEGDAATELLERLMPYISEALTMPIYSDPEKPDEQSMEKIAALAGVTLPESEYNSVPSLMVAVLGGFFAGDENLTADSVEIKLLIECVRAGLVSALSGMTAELLFGGAVGDFFSMLGFYPQGVFENFFVKQIYRSSYIKKIMSEVLTPVINGITSDYYEPSDLNVELESYSSAAAVSSGAPISFWQKLKSIIGVQ